MVDLQGKTYRRKRAPVNYDKIVFYHFGKHYTHRTSEGKEIPGWRLYCQRINETCIEMNFIPDEDAEQFVLKKRHTLIEEDDIAKHILTGEMNAQLLQSV